MIVFDCEQGTQEWKEARSGRVTGSRVKDVLAKIKSGAPAASRADYLTDMVCEILTGTPSDDVFVTREMQWGKDQEPFARAAYEAQTDTFVDQVGFVFHPTISRGGASPDGVIGWNGGDDDAEGIVEIKCPKSKTHLGYILSGVVPEEYMPQILWEMRCTGAKWCDFVSYDPRMPENLQLYIKRFERDDAKIAVLDAEIESFLDEVNRNAEELRGMRLFGIEDEFPL